MSLAFSDYNKHVREFKLEELCDFLIYRPIAFMIVKATYKLPLNPNHFSLAALLFAIFAGIQLAHGTPQGFMLAGISVFMFSTLDCCDGIVARSKKNGSQYGTFIDMLVDLISNICFYVGLFIGLRKTQNSVLIPYLSFVSSLFILLHASLYHFYKKQYLCYLDKNPDGRQAEIENYRKEYENLKKSGGHFFETILLRAFLLFSKYQKDSKKIVKYKIDLYPVRNKPLLPFWGAIAGSTHLTVLALALIFQNIFIYFYFALVVSNLWMTFVSVLQNKTNAAIIEGY